MHLTSTSSSGFMKNSRFSESSTLGLSETTSKDCMIDKIFELQVILERANLQNLKLIEVNLSLEAKLKQKKQKVNEIIVPRNSQNLDLLYQNRNKVKKSYRHQRNLSQPAIQITGEDQPSYMHFRNNDQQCKYPKTFFNSPTAQTKRTEQFEYIPNQPTESFKQDRFTKFLSTVMIPDVNSLTKISEISCGRKIGIKKNGVERKKNIKTFENEEYREENYRIASPFESIEDIWNNNNSGTEKKTLKKSNLMKNMITFDSKISKKKSYLNK